MVISDLAKAIPASDSEINNEWVVRNTHRFFPGEPEPQLEASNGSKQGFTKRREFMKKELTENDRRGE